MTRTDTDQRDDADREESKTRIPDLSDIKGQNSIQYTVDVSDRPR